ncbi:hypothetical protein TNCV_2709411 [Trichonephila clavipes]|nr:hypothetical protein TNCV_2709411 [Trichonephila clavipes]
MWIPHNSNIPGRFVTRKVLLQSSGSTNFMKNKAIFFFKGETDESHLVRDQDSMAGDVGFPNQELQYGLRYCRRVWPRIVIQQQKVTFEKLRPLFTNCLFRFRLGVKVPHSIYGSNLQKVPAKIYAPFVCKDLSFFVGFFEAYQALSYSTLTTVEMGNLFFDSPSPSYHKKIASGFEQCIK